MLDAIRKIFQEEAAPSGKPGDDVEHRIQVSTCALLLEIAWADDDFTDQERDAVETLIRDHFDLDVDALSSLFQLAESERIESTDFYQFTRLMRDELSREERLEVLGMLWTVVYSDGVLEVHEDALVHKLTRLLGLRHQEAIALKVRARNAADRH